MFTALSRGVPSFGDLAWKAPVVAASDPSAAWTFPLPVLAPVGAAARGQTLTAGANESINTAAPFAGMGLVVGDRILATAAHGVANSAGIWVVTVVGSAAAKWVLTRATDADTAAELVEGATAQAFAFLLSGVIYSDFSIWTRNAAGNWHLTPTLIDSLTVVLALTVGDGSVTPALVVKAGMAGDSLALDEANRDVWLYRSAAATAKLDTDGAGTELTAAIIAAAKVYSATGASTTFTISGGGTATYSGKSLTWYRLGKLVVFDLKFSVTAAGSGATAVTIANPAELPQAVVSPLGFIGDRGGTGVQPLVGRFSNDGTRLTLDGFKILTATGTGATITGADLANGAVYQVGGAYVAS